MLIAEAVPSCIEFSLARDKHDPVSETDHKKGRRCSSTASSCPPASGTRIILATIARLPGGGRDRRGTGHQKIPAAGSRRCVSLG